MSAETDLNAALKAAAGVTAIVGSGDSARIYPDLVPQERALPAVAYGRADTEYTTTIHTSTPIGETPIIDVWCMHTTRAGADALAAAVLAAAGGAGFQLRSRSAIPPDNEQAVLGTVLQVSRFYNL